MSNNFIKFKCVTNLGSLPWHLSLDQDPLAMCSWGSLCFSFLILTQGCDYTVMGFFEQFLCPYLDTKLLAGSRLFYSTMCPQHIVSP